VEFSCRSAGDRAAVPALQFSSESWMHQVGIVTLKTWLSQVPGGGEMLS
jgi:hypothetical protein